RDNLEGLREYAAMMIRTMTKALDASPYAQGPDKAELNVRFWATLASMAQNRCGLAKAALGGEGPTPTGYMTRAEAAEYLRISTRQLDRLRLPHTVLGRSPRYSRQLLDEYLQQRTMTPGPKQKSEPVTPLRYQPPRHREPTDVNERIAMMHCRDNQ